MKVKEGMDLVRYCAKVLVIGLHADVFSKSPEVVRTIKRARNAVGIIERITGSSITSQIRHSISGTVSEVNIILEKEEN